MFTKCICFTTALRCAEVYSRRYFHYACVTHCQCCDHVSEWRVIGVVHVLLRLSFTKFLVFNDNIVMKECDYQSSLCVNNILFWSRLDLYFMRALAGRNGNVVGWHSTNSVCKRVTNEQQPLKEFWVWALKCNRDLYTTFYFLYSNDWCISLNYCYKLLNFSAVRLWEAYIMWPCVILSFISRNLLSYQLQYWNGHAKPIYLNYLQI